jgi:hypothetical protein
MLNDDMKYKNIFEFFRMGMVTGLMTKEQVIQWADMEILHNGSIDPDLLELSLSGRLPYSQLLGVMNTFEGIPDYTTTINWVLTYASIQKIEDYDDIKRIVQGIRLLKAEAHIEKEVSNKITKLEEDSLKYELSNITKQIMMKRLNTFIDDYSQFKDDVEKIFLHSQIEK